MSYFKPNERSLIIKLWTSLVLILFIYKLFSKLPYNVFKIISSSPN